MKKISLNQAKKLIIIADNTADKSFQSKEIDGTHLNMADWKSLGEDYFWHDEKGLIGPEGNSTRSFLKIDESIGYPEWETCCPVCSGNILNNNECFCLPEAVAAEYGL